MPNRIPFSTKYDALTTASEQQGGNLLNIVKQHRDNCDSRVAEIDIRLTVLKQRREEAEKKGNTAPATKKHEEDLRKNRERLIALSKELSGLMETRIGVDGPLNKDEDPNDLWLAVKPKLEEANQLSETPNQEKKCIVHVFSQNGTSHVFTDPKTGEALNLSQEALQRALKKCMTPTSQGGLGLHVQQSGIMDMLRMKAKPGYTVYTFRSPEERQQFISVALQEMKIEQQEKKAAEAENKKQGVGFRAEPGRHPDPAQVRLRAEGGDPDPEPEPAPGPSPS